LNIGYYLAGWIISSTTGDDFAQSLKTLVLAPAGLSEARLAAAKDDLNGVQMGSAQGYDPGWVLHGLLVGPIAEAATFLHRLLSGAIIGRPMLAEMLKVRLLPQYRSELWPNPAYGLGIMGAWNGAPSPWGHSGEGPGSVIAVYGCALDDQVKVAAVWQSPGSVGQAEAAALEALDHL
jgi:CubicO group peptidase (beta-lactamase class C family)